MNVNHCLRILLVLVYIGATVFSVHRRDSVAGIWVIMGIWSFHEMWRKRRKRRKNGEE
jgi:hypothetical protein